MRKERPAGNGADFGCGDGSLSYVMAGGKFSNFDVFQNVTRLDLFSKGADIFDLKAKIKPSVDGSHLRYRYLYGIDHKRGLIDKARQLGGFYEKTLVQDLNKPLPLHDDELDWGFSNVLYWLENPVDVLREWGRCIKRSHRLYLFVPDESFKEKAWLYYKAPHSGKRAFLNFFDRGYGKLIKHDNSRSKWVSIFEKSGFRVVSHRSYLSDAVMEIWNIGTRPIAHLLIDMAARLSPRNRTLVKRKWIASFKDFFRPILLAEIMSKSGHGGDAFHFFVLENVK